MDYTDRYSAGVLDNPLFVLFNTVDMILVKRGLVKRGLVKRGLVKRELVKQGQVKRGLVKRGLRIGSCGRLFFLDFSAFVNRIKLNGEQTFTKTNLRLEILFIYF